MAANKARLYPSSARWHVSCQHTRISRPGHRGRTKFDSAPPCGNYITSHVSLKEIDKAGGELNEMTTREKKILLFTPMPATRYDQLKVGLREANALVDYTRLTNESWGGVIDWFDKTDTCLRP